MNTDQHLDTQLIEYIERKEFFQRSVNIAYDNNNIEAIENFYCPISYEQILIKMVQHIDASGQAAFTWTGPYGSGKSSLAIFLQALISDDPQLVQEARSKLSEENKETIIKHFSSEGRKWKVLSLVGKAKAPEQILIDALKLQSDTSTDDLLKILECYVAEGQHLFIFMDELGKVFDGAAKSNRPEDIYFLQQLAELVNRSQGKIVFVGVLHQSFMAYARQATSKMHDEWLKIQGRFIDCAVTLSVDEQIHLISRVIHVNNSSLLDIRDDENFSSQVSAVVKNITTNRKTKFNRMTELLTNVFPIHPLVAVLLCQLSKRNFGQNQRSIFSFLMSAEPNGFSYYLKNTTLDDFKIFTVEMFWDYLDSNLNSTIQASEYSKQWLLSQMAVSRYEELNNETAVKLIKIVTLISIFADGTGIHASQELLKVVLNVTDKELSEVISALESASIIFYRKFTQSYTLSEGSDFNLTDAIKEQLQELHSLPFEQLEQFEPIVAKSHYQLTGNLRWMQVKLLPVTLSIEDSLVKLQKNINTSLVGYYCLLMPKSDDELKLAIDICEMVSNSDKFSNIVIAILDSHTTIIDMLKDKIALGNILKNEEKLLNDKIARQETEGRLVEVEDALNRMLDKSLSNSKWYSKYIEEKGRLLNRFRLSSLASVIADEYVSECIVCNNELVNRNKPSPSAKGAIRELLKRMIENGHEQSLGIEKFPPERGIYESVILKNGLHATEDGENYYFSRPLDKKIKALWSKADEIIKDSKGGLVTAQQIYNAWVQTPYGVKAGLHEILYIAYILSRHNDLANYINGEYKPTVQYLLAEYLIKVPDEVGVREVSFLEGTQQWIYVLQDSLQENFGDRLGKKIENEPLPIAQALIRVFDQMHPWIKRTNELSPKTKQLRNILKQANDPNQLLFDDLPKFFNAKDDDDQKVAKIIEALYELDYKYPNLVSDINNKLLDYLKVEQQELNPFAEINKRAEALFGRSGDYLLDAYIARLVKYDGSMNDAESLISLLAGNKPAKKWIDQDIIRALQQIAAYSFQFLEAEVNADVNSGPDRQKVGLITKSPNATTSHVREAHITSRNLKTVTDKAQEILNSLEQSGLDLNDRVAVIAKLLEGFKNESKEK